MLSWHLPTNRLPANLSSRPAWVIASNEGRWTLPRLIPPWKRLTCRHESRHLLLPGHAQAGRRGGVRAKGILVMSFPNYRWWTRLGLTIVNLVFRFIRMQFR